MDNNGTTHEFINKDAYVSYKFKSIRSNLNNILFTYNHAKKALTKDRQHIIVSMKRFIKP